MDFDIVILGAGPGGYVAAERAAALGKKVCIVEREHLGGTCLNWGCIPTKTFLASSKIFYLASHGDAFGVKASGVEFDFKKVFERKEKVVSTLRNGIAGMMRRGKVEVVTGEGKLIKGNQVQVGERIISATDIIIATGSSPARPPIPGIDQNHVYDSTRILADQTLPKKLVVIGGGVIGIEFACFYGSLGIPVAIVEMLPEICPGMDADIAKTLRSELANKNITFYLGAKVTEITANGVRFSAAGKEELVEADRVLVATGRVPNIKGIGLEDAGVEFERSGIKIDDCCRTNVPHVWAVGDCAGKVLLAHVASRHAEVAVNNICGRVDHMRYCAIPGVVYASPEVATVGLTEVQAKEKGIPVQVAKLPLGVSGRFLAENEGARGQIKVIVHQEDRRVLGVHMLGNLSSEIIWGACAIIETELRVQEIKEIVFPHPTVGEVIKDAVFSLGH